MTNDWILVGVDGAEGGESAVRYAARAAARMGCGLRLLHVAPDLAAKRGDAYADVLVEIDVVQGQPAKAVVDASRTADLLVIIRRPLAFPFGSLGGTGRAILRESRCPVEVLPATARRRADGRNRGAEPAALGVMF